uniref:Uncharacterized protein n=1 Tax=Glossina palpalis gambiensis TaxID=67801 RepID=A0A1B0BPG1_9MUSC
MVSQKCINTRLPVFNTTGQKNPRKKCLINLLQWLVAFYFVKFLFPLPSTAADLDEGLNNNKV